jgi:hypothetical protein
MTYRSRYDQRYNAGVTRKITISVPDDVAERLDREPNVSGYITGLARADIYRETVHQHLAEAGITVTEAGKLRFRERLRRARAGQLPHLPDDTDD